MYPYILIGGRQFAVYGICAICGILIAAAISVHRANKNSLSAENVIIYFACITGFAFAGAKLLYLIITWGLQKSLEMLMQGKNSELFLQGGFIFYGGLIGGILGIPLAERISASKAADYYSSIVPAIPIAHGIGRIGCFFAGCCYGIEYYGPGSVSFPHAVSGLSPHVKVFPVQLLEMAVDMLISVRLFYVSSRRTKETILPEYLLDYSIARFFIEFLRGDPGRGKLAFFSTSQWISFVLFCSIVFEFQLLKKRNRIAKS